MQKTILVVDDQLSTRKLLHHYLNRYFNVISKEGAVDALSWIQEGNAPDIVVADLMMPGVSGFDFIKKLAGLLPALPPVIVLSSVENSAEKIRCFNLGIRDYLLKPFNPDELRLRIDNLLKHN